MLDVWNGWLAGLIIGWVCLLPFLCIYILWRRSKMKSSDDWLQEPQYKNILIIDPDGWDRKNFEKSWKELLTEEEFKKRVSESTIMIGDEYAD